MALLLSVRRLISGDGSSAFAYSEQRSPSVALVTLHEDEHVASFRNPTFEDDFHSERSFRQSLSITVPIVKSESTFEDDKKLNFTNEENRCHSDAPSILLSSYDSEICFWVKNDDSASVGDKSLDSGVGGENNKVVDQPSGLPRSRLPSSEEKEKNFHSRVPENLWTLFIQVLVPFLVAGIGTCGAGLLLDTVEKWDVFQAVSELFVLVPTLLGLKGNLEMTLASRLSTQANLGKMETLGQQWHAAWGNMALLQCQAIVLGFFASCFASISSAMGEDGFRPREAFLLGASALSTASLASFILGGITFLVVVISHRFHIDPDNVASPIAASLGDVTTLAILAVISSALYPTLTGSFLHSALVFGAFAATIPLWIILSYKNESVRPVLFSGWAPILIALLITSAGGYILEYSVSQFQGFAIFQPVINGVAGNLVAVQASRISTTFHRDGIPKSLPPDGSSLCFAPHRTFLFKGSAHARTARVLLALVIPGHLLFGYGIAWVKGGDTALSSPSFVPLYLASALIQVALLLYLAKASIHWLWRWGIDPDNAAIPFLTAMGDFSGTVALTMTFFLHRVLFEKS